MPRIAGITRFDVALASALFVIKLVTLVTGVQPGAGAISYVVLPLWTLPLAWRRSRPVAVAAAVAVAALLEIGVGGYRDSVVALACFVVVPYSLAAYYARGRDLAGGLAVFVPAGLVSAVAQSGGVVANLAAAVFLLVAAMLAGLWVRQLRLRAETLEHMGEDRVRAALAEERARIARDLHDEVAHAMSVIAVQADAAEGALTHDPTLVRAPLVAIRATARDALADMRRVLGSLRRDGEVPSAPEPGLARLGALVDQSRAGGLAVDVAVDGEPKPLPPPVDIAAYRVVQEALTNVRKHSGAQRVQIRLRFEIDAVVIEVADDGDGSGVGGGSGQGLMGLRERVAVLGGRLMAAPARHGYVVRASLPLR